MEIGQRVVCKLHLNRLGASRDVVLKICRRSVVRSDAQWLLEVANCELEILDILPILSLGVIKAGVNCRIDTSEGRSETMRVCRRIVPFPKMSYDRDWGHSRSKINGHYSWSTPLMLIIILRKIAIVCFYACIEATNVITRGSPRSIAEETIDCDIS